LGRRSAAVKRGARRCASAATAKRRPKPSACCPTGLRGSTPGNRPPATTTGSCSTPQPWSGSGRTLAATPATLSSVVSRASAGDTIELADGVYNGASVTLTKAVRLRAAHQFGAVLVGGPTPRYANDTGLGGHTGTAISVRASGAVVEGLELRYYSVGIDLDSVANVTVTGNRVVSMYDAGIQVWDTRNAEVRCNQVLDPYLAQDAPATVTSGPGISEAQSDYGVAVYGSLQPRVEHNYFHGVFNQTVSFKEGNRDAYAGYNTFEGSALTALFFGQNIPHNGPYSFTGLPVDEDRGTIVAEYNVFREVYGIRDGAKVVYYLRSPVRVWHVDGKHHRAGQRHRAGTAGRAARVPVRLAGGLQRRHDAVDRQHDRRPRARPRRHHTPGQHHRRRPRVHRSAGPGDAGRQRLRRIGQRRRLLQRRRLGHAEPRLHRQPRAVHGHGEPRPAPGHPQHRPRLLVRGRIPLKARR
jgi:hypothetical protein